MTAPQENRGSAFGIAARPPDAEVLGLARMAVVTDPRPPILCAHMPDPASGDPEPSGNDPATGRVEANRGRTGVEMSLPARHALVPLLEELSEKGKREPAPPGPSGGEGVGLSVRPVHLGPRHQPRQPEELLSRIWRRHENMRAEAASRRRRETVNRITAACAGAALGAAHAAGILNLLSVATFSYGCALIGLMGAYGVRVIESKSEPPVFWILETLARWWLFAGAVTVLMEILPHVWGAP